MGYKETVQAAIASLSKPFMFPEEAIGALVVMDTIACGLLFLTKEADAAELIQRESPSLHEVLRALPDDRRIHHEYADAALRLQEECALIEYKLNVDDDARISLKAANQYREKIVVGCEQVMIGFRSLTDASK